MEQIEDNIQNIAIEQPLKFEYDFRSFWIALQICLLSRILYNGACGYAKFNMFYSNLPYFLTNFFTLVMLGVFEFGTRD